MTKRGAAIVAFTVLCVVAAIFVPPIAQPLSYHAFADRRSWLGVDNFLDVVSNAAFLAAGLAGLVLIVRGRAVFEHPSERWPYAVFFLGLILTALGSAYYHLAPDNARLVWDRLPITITLMGLLAGQAVERIGIRAGLSLLGPAIVVGLASVLYWDYTEHAGRGNLVPYAIVQGYSMLAVMLLALLYPSRYTRGSDIKYVFGLYVLAKLFESFDEAIYRMGHVVSGHTLKHLAAAMAGVVVCMMLARRKIRR
jgi:hypothetical protein